MEFASSWPTVDYCCACDEAAMHEILWNDRTQQAQYWKKRIALELGQTSAIDWESIGCPPPQLSLHHNPRCNPRFFCTLASGLLGTLTQLQYDTGSTRQIIPKCPIRGMADEDCASA